MTVRDLQEKLQDFAAEDPKNLDREVVLVSKDTLMGPWDGTLDVYANRETDSFLFNGKPAVALYML